MQNKIVLVLLISSALPLTAQELPPGITPSEFPMFTQEGAVETAPVEAVPTATAEPETVAPILPVTETEAAPVVTSVAQPQQEEAATVIETPESIPPVSAGPDSAAVLAQSDQEIEIKGIDTVDVHEPKGNWLYKRIWWEKAERLYEKTKQLADKILELRLSFFTRRYDLDHRVLDPFYLGLGLDQSELSDVISYLMQESDKKLVTDQENQKEPERENVVNVEKKTLEQLQQEVQRVTKINHAIDEALMKLIEQFNQARFYEQQSWENFKAINRELNDKKARELYYGMDTYWKNLNNINNYLSDAFTKYFEQLTTKIQQETNTVKTTLQALKEKGIDIQVQAQKMKRPPTPVKETQEAEEEETEPQGLLGTVWNWITAPFVLIGDTVTGTYNWITHFFRGTEPEETLPDTQTEQEPAESEVAEDQE